MSRPIRQWPEACLQTVCAEVTDFDAARLLADEMFQTMYGAPGRGLAAPQVGETLRLFVMDAGWKSGTRTPLACVNPQIEVLDGPEQRGDEGCLSMPGLIVTVPRVEHIRLSYTDLAGQAQSVTLTGAAARIAQHEADHLDGVMHLDRVTPAARAQALKEWETR